MRHVRGGSRYRVNNKSYPVVNLINQRQSNHRLIKELKGVRKDEGKNMQEKSCSMLVRLSEVWTERTQSVYLIAGSLLLLIRLSDWNRQQDGLRRLGDEADEWHRGAKGWMGDKCFEGIKFNWIWLVWAVTYKITSYTDRSLLIHSIHRHFVTHAHGWISY